MIVSKFLRKTRLKVISFPDISDYRLGVTRFILFGSYFIFSVPTRFESLAFCPQELVSPPSLFYYLPQLHLGYDHFLLVTYIWKTSLLFAAIGIFTTPFCWLAALSSLYVLGWPIAFIPSDFMYQVPVLAMVTLATSPAIGSRFSLDSLIRKKKVILNDETAGFYIKFVQFLVCLMYFKAGVSKLHLSGVAWISDDLLLGHLKRVYTAHLSNFSEVGLQLHAFVLKNPDLIRLGASGTLLLELTSLLPLFFVRLIPLYLVMWVCFHVSIYLLMGISAAYWLLPLVAFFVPWDKIMRIKAGIE